MVKAEATVTGQAPRMARFSPAMVKAIAEEWGLNGSEINGKAKSAERLGALGRGEGVAAEAVCLIARTGERV